MREYMTAMQWNQARHSSRWLVAYVEALREHRPVALLKPDIYDQKKLCFPTRAYIVPENAVSDAEKLCQATRAGQVIEISAENVRFLTR
jgi:hypothetical protein